MGTCLVRLPISLSLSACAGEFPFCVLIDLWTAWVYNMKEVVFLLSIFITCCDALDNQNSSEATHTRHTVQRNYENESEVVRIRSRPALRQIFKEIEELSLMKWI